ncbi:MAG: glycosyl hydrolase family 95 catalytic domain-containing protein, partial [Luteolibacter sp.]
MYKVSMSVIQYLEKSFPVKFAGLIACLLTISFSRANSLSLIDDRPAKSWENDGYPIGNGSMGAVLYGGIEEARMQFTVDSLWTGNENPGGEYIDKADEPGGDCFGSFQSMGELRFQMNGSVGVPFSESHFGIGNAGQTIEASHDGKPESKWCFEFEKPSEIYWQIDAGEPALISGYSLCSGNDMPQRDPWSWVFEGSNDGETWHVLDRKNEMSPIEGRGSTVRFPVASKDEFRFYRFRFTPRPGTDHFQIADIGVIGLSSQATVTGYRRELDISKAIHRTSWQKGGVTFTREAFASYPEGVIAWRITASQPGMISGQLSMLGAHPDREKIKVRKNCIQLIGALENGLEYAADVAVWVEGGSLIARDSCVELSDCDSAIIILAADTNYTMDRGKNWRNGRATDRTEKRLQQALSKSWEKLVEEHIVDYQLLFNRVVLDLGQTDLDTASVPLRDRIERYRREAREFPRPCLDPDLEELLFQYGRYLLIASSRPGSLPANLQGVWNNSNRPAWFSDYHTNINLQMNYWLAEAANLPELV